MGLDSVELIMDIEKEFDLTIPDEVAAKMNTVGDLHGYLCAEMKRLGRTGWGSVFVLERMTEIICRNLGIKPERVVPTARFVDDLGVD